MSNDFWAKKNLSAPGTQAPRPTQVEQEVEDTVTQSMEEMESDTYEPESYDEEIDDDSEVLNNANLRLEQGRLYQMIMSHDLFGETDADEKAIKNVQREIRKFARERMEIMLGMRHEAASKETVVSSPFNELEVVALKAIASQMSKGVTKTADKPKEPVIPKKDGITSISGSMKLKGTATALPNKEFKPLPKNRVVEKDVPKAEKPSAPKATGPKEESFLSKPIDQMTPDELLAYDSEREKRSYNLKAALPPNMVPIPSPSELEGLYATRQANMINSPGSAAAAIVKLLGNR